MATNDVSRIADTGLDKEAPIFWSTEALSGRRFEKPASVSRFSDLSSPDLEEAVPSVKISENKSHILVTAELPGMEKQDVDVTLSNTAVTVAGEKKTLEKAKICAGATPCLSFYYASMLPCEVYADRAKTIFKDGILTIRAPKCEETRSSVKKMFKDWVLMDADAVLALAL